MRNVPEDDYDNKQLARLNAEPWMIELLAYNPEYVLWGPHEDYMMNNNKGWDSPQFIDGWPEFSNSWELDHYNEVVNFYFQLDRKNEKCTACDASGYNPETRKIADDFYDFARTGRRWCDNITQDELEALQENHRFGCWIEGQWVKAKITAEEVNAANRKGGSGQYSHDAINRFILIETRARRLGVWGDCEKCEGHGYIYTEPKAKVQLVLWVLHPRKGCSRGIEVRGIKQKDLPEVFKFLHEAAERNAARFSKVPKVTA